MSDLKRITSSMRDGSEGECEESCSIIPVETSFTFAQKSVCPESSDDSGNIRKYDYIETESRHPCVGDDKTVD